MTVWFLSPSWTQTDTLARGHRPGSSRQIGNQAASVLDSVVRPLHGQEGTGLMQCVLM